MKKINWKHETSDYHVGTFIGSVRLHCFSELMKPSKCRWYAYVVFNDTVRWGVIRNTLAKAKTDASTIAKEILLDYRASIDAELENWE